MTSHAVTVADIWWRGQNAKDIKSRMLAQLLTPFWRCLLVNHKSRKMALNMENNQWNFYPRKRCNIITNRTLSFQTIYYDCCRNAAGLIMALLGFSVGGGTCTGDFYFIDCLIVAFNLLPWLSAIMRLSFITFR